MIRVCDAIMGTGKSSAAITYMNERPHDKFIYITPYLPEAKRIKDACPALRFVEPRTDVPEFGGSKVRHTQHLIECGKNVATTHSAFLSYTPNIIETIREQDYTLIVDENISILSSVDCNYEDIQMAIDAGYIDDDNGTFTIVKKDYTGGLLKDVFMPLRSRELVRVDSSSGKLYYWALPADFFLSFKDVFVLTYLFEGQSIHHLFKMYDIDYSFVNIEKDGDTYRFTDGPGYIPEYVAHLDEMIEIYEDNPDNRKEKKLNDIGENRNWLSKTWYEREVKQKECGRIKDVGNNVRYYFRYIAGNPNMTNRFWGAFSLDSKKLNRAKKMMYADCGAGAFVNFNTRAMNTHKDKHVMAYVVNVFMNLNEKTFYESHGIDVDESAYATSTMVQWIWRSAIREGEKVQLYVPSSRMRGFLYKWMHDEKEKAIRNNYTQPFPEFNPGEIWAPGVKTLEANVSLLGVV